MVANLTARSVGYIIDTTLLAMITPTDLKNLFGCFGQTDMSAMAANSMNLMKLIDCCLRSVAMSLMIVQIDLTNSIDHRQKLPVMSKRIVQMGLPEIYCQYLQQVL
jgi:hypothetical protein